MIWGHHVFGKYDTFCMTRTGYIVALCNLWTVSKTTRFASTNLFIKLIIKVLSLSISLAANQTLRFFINSRS